MCISRGLFKLVQMNLDEAADQSIVRWSDPIPDDNVNMDLANLEIGLLSICKVIHATLLFDLIHDLAELEEELLDSLQVDTGLALGPCSDGILQCQFGNFTLSYSSEGVGTLEKQILVNDLESDGFLDGLEGTIDTITRLEHD